VLANGLAEMVGLGLSGAFFVYSMAQEDRWGIILAALAGILVSTLVEGTAVGLAQGRVLRRPLPRLRLRAWWAGTAAGAFVAWTLGMLPSTLIGLMQQAEGAGAAPMAEPSQALTFLLAAGLGMVAGPVLGIGQWWVLRKHVAHAGWWIPAQSLGWAVGMPIIFQMIDWIAPGAFTATDALLAAGMLFLAGAAVGALHGLVLVRLLRQPLAEDAA
jgi:NhaP-type Na+/H+ or K+/H+ antiporter